MKNFSLARCTDLSPTLFASPRFVFGELISSPPKCDCRRGILRGKLSSVCVSVGELDHVLADVTRELSVYSRPCALTRK